MLYTEKFKKEVVKKALSPGVIQADICRKLKICESSLHNWKRKYRVEVEKEIVEIDVASILKEEEIDLDRMLREAGRLEKEQQEDREELTIDKIFSPSRKSKEVKASEKSAIVTEYRKLSQRDAGSFLRRYGLHSQEIKSWEGEILSMGKKQIDKDEYIKKLEAEKKALEKRVKNLERDKHELEYIIEIKKSTLNFSGWTRTAHQSRTQRNDSRNNAKSQDRRNKTREYLQRHRDRSKDLAELEKRRLTGQA